jgi:phosphatidate cytidylyltransferase
LKQRIVTASVLIPIAIIWLFFLPLNQFSIVAGVLFFLAGREWSRFSSISNTLIFAASYVVILILSCWMISFSFQAQGPIPLVLQVILGAGALWWCLALRMILRYPGYEAWWKHHVALKWLFGLLTLLPFFWALVVLRTYHTPGDHSVGSWRLLFVMSLVWVADTGAYVVGRKFGARKLLPAVSPNKTIEGLLGGVGAASLLAIFVTLARDVTFRESLAIVVSSILAVLASVLGDLTESLFKREAGMKDSGSLLPGHGGVMDRIDSLTAALPVFVISYLLIS